MVVIKESGTHNGVPVQSLPQFLVLVPIIFATLKPTQPYCKVVFTFELFVNIYGSWFVAFWKSGVLDFLLVLNLRTPAMMPCPRHIAHLTRCPSPGQGRSAVLNRSGTFLGAPS